MAGSGQSCCDWFRQGLVTQMGTGKGTPDTAWNYWKSASAFLVTYELGAAWDTMRRELHENEVFTQGSRAERDWTDGLFLSTRIQLCLK